MKITRISAWALDLPLAEPYWLSGGRLRFDALDSTWVRIDTDGGLSGWGEACPWGHTYLPAHGPGVRAGLQVLAPALVGRDPRSIDALNRSMDVALPGHGYVKAPLDMACWDILGQATGLPLWQLWGGDEAAAVALNSSIATGDPEAMVARIGAARAAGYRHHSAKIGGSDPRLDLARIEAIAADLPADETVTFDINRAWTPGVAIQVLNATASRAWVEQPCETLAQCAQVAARVPQPLLLDECLHTVDDHLRAWYSGACEGAKIKPNRVGGLTAARRLRDLGVALGWQLHIEDVGGTVLADTAAIHLAASTPPEHRLASWLCHPHLAVDLLPGQGARPVAGYTRPPSLPGLGVTPSPEVLGEPHWVYPPL
ncbi:MAG: mandelate racemase/muconate lactonizing enzyme family protein [Candidatus Competibacterales bacterium]